MDAGSNGRQQEDLLRIPRQLSPSMRGFYFGCGMAPPLRVIDHCLWYWQRGSHAALTADHSPSVAYVAELAATLPSAASWHLLRHTSEQAASQASQVGRQSSAPQTASPG